MPPLVESFVFGAANSVHCACMCGPLAIAFHGGTGGSWSYHIGRTFSYGALGVVLGLAGRAVGSHELGEPTAWVSFVLAAGLVLTVLLGTRGTLRIPGLGALTQRVLARTRALPPAWRALALGLGTPLLPCGLLWAACAGAAVAGSGIDGGGVMVGFALGSLPLLWLAQSQAVRLAQRFGPTTMLRVQRLAMLSAAGVLVWRGIVALQGGSCCD